MHRWQRIEGLTFHGMRLYCNAGDGDIACEHPAEGKLVGIDPIIADVIARALSIINP